jgi:hypothetical protein
MSRLPQFYVAVTEGLLTKWKNNLIYVERQKVLQYIQAKTKKVSFENE